MSSELIKGWRELHEAEMLSYEDEEEMLATLEHQQAEVAKLREVYAVVLALADWSERHPRTRIYHAARQEEMDAQLIALEESAKTLTNKDKSNDE